ncbi:hypothetical protein CC78DRAFT_581024 [Lojkania enalia]|uniref:Uncharacterized protein n=1 Tax=Lojkania enalia TaxID=147567 RepID=A0A9P4K6V1_9PLEO|nr:hypothetical protein CC78DRAFT_581024 [Didymosphaeria enalia]
MYLKTKAGQQPGSHVTGTPIRCHVLKCRASPGVPPHSEAHFMRSNHASPEAASGVIGGATTSSPVNRPQALRQARKARKEADHNWLLINLPHQAHAFMHTAPNWHTQWPSHSLALISTDAQDIDTYRTGQGSAEGAVGAGSAACARPAAQQADRAPFSKSALSGRHWTWPLIPSVYSRPPSLAASEAGWPVVAGWQFPLSLEQPSSR